VVLFDWRLVLFIQIMRGGSAAMINASAIGFDRLIDGPV